MKSIPISIKTTLLLFHNLWSSHTELPFQVVVPTTVVREQVVTSTRVEFQTDYQTSYVTVQGPAQVRFESNDVVLTILFNLYYLYYLTILLTILCNYILILFKVQSNELYVVEFLIVFLVVITSTIHLCCF